MNKKLLFAALSLAALTACTNDDFEKQQIAAEESSPIQFEVINDAFTRASMDGNNVKWSAADGDLFTLYHGATLGAVTGYENATYSAKAEVGKAATLTTPTMIKQGGAIMVWPVDSEFNIKPTNDLTLSIPLVQGGKVNGKEIIQNQIPYVSDLLDIKAYAPYSEEAAPGVIPTAYKTAGLGRKYQVYMRPMASQLNLNADYAGTEDQIATLYKGGSEGLSDAEAIDEIKVTSVELLTAAATAFTQKIPLKFTAPTTAILGRWNLVANNRVWDQVTNFNIATIGTKGVQTNKLTTKCLTGNKSSKFLILPQATMADGTGGLASAGIVVNTIYGKVVIADGAHGSQYDNSGGATDEIGDAWYRYVSAVPTPGTEPEGETVDPTPLTIGGKTKYKASSNPKFGLKQTINGFSAYTSQSDPVVQDEPVGTYAERYVKVLLTHLDMSGLHIKNDKQLRDVARVWKKMGLGAVTVYLDGDANDEFAISQNTISVINEVNKGKAFANWFKVMPCQESTSEDCSTIVITEGGDVQDIDFIADNVGFKAEVVFNAGETWTWKGTVAVETSGVSKIINKGDMENKAASTLKSADHNGTQNKVLLENEGTWTISGGELNVQFDVTNYGTVTIAAGAEYRQAKGSANTTFLNQATAVPSRFTLAAVHDDAQIGKIHNSGVFATLASTGSEITNYGEIYHDNKAAKTYITNNQTTPVTFSTAFGAANKMGMIILPFDNKDEDNISVKAALNQGFVAVLVNAENAPSDGILDATTVGPRVNYVKIDGGIHTVADMPASQIKYVEFNSGTTEIDWAVTTAQTYEGMMVLSPVNIKLGTSITVTKATYLGANMYVGGTFNKGSWSGYFGNTSSNEATKYITF